MSKKVAIIGGGAAGFFTAINLAYDSPEAEITIYEASNKFLAKVIVSGGGRCNVTNKISEPSELIKNYPRGKNFLKPVFERFSSIDTIDWFKARGVELKTEEDGRLFPVTDSSLTIYDCLTREVRKHGVKLLKGHRMLDYKRQDDKWKLTFKEDIIEVDYLVLATGSSPAVYSMLEQNSLKIIAPLPSLFTFNAKQHIQLPLAGVSVENAITSIKEIKGSKEDGPLLVTHWGYSAPSILKLSAWYARELAALNYNFHLVINWNSYNPIEIATLFKAYGTEIPKDKVYSWKGHNLSKRLWQSLFAEAGLKEYTNWSEIGKKGIARLVTVLCNYSVAIQGKSTFKEEFVTAGGISLETIDVDTFEVKNETNIFAVGEVLNIDAVTGGFNFQAAWSGAYTVSKALSSRINS